MGEYQPGTAPIKPEFLRESWPARSEPLAGSAQSTEPGAEAPSAPDDEPPAEAPAPAAEAERPRKRVRGQNKARQFARTDDIVSLCTQIARGEPCAFGDQCKYGHDLCAYLTHKRRDIPFLAPPPTGSVRTLPPDERDAYLDSLYAQAVQSEQPPAAAPPPADPVQASLDYSTECPYFSERGTCPAGWRCRFLGAHVRRVSASHACVGAEAQGMLGTGLELVHDPARAAAWRSRPTTAQPENDEVNWLAPGVAKSLRSKKYAYDKAPIITQVLADEAQALHALSPAEAATSPLGKGPLRIDYEQHRRLERLKAASMRPDAAEEALEAYEDALRNAREGSDAAADTARVRPAEKRRLQWKGELYLAPLTTTGNLPFRRLCASFGSDIHCGEMGMAESFTSGHASEWSLVRRWEGERIFGTQLCGAKPEFLVPAAEVLAREVGTGLDFVDVNCGCPIDLVYNKGAGSALLDHANKLGRIVRGMSEALGEVPLTIKLRTGTTAKQTTHKIFARAQTEWGVGGMTLHGRSRKQRYKNDADWAYIGQCVDALHSSVRTWNEESRWADAPEMVPVPVYGNGDVYGWRDYYEHLESTGVDGAMIARGALIKPWIFTEIKERRDWDISSRERLDLVRQFASYGLTHWGADTQGVNTTRRFLCEMLSFTHRYVPLGLLEHVPVRMNDRPRPFRGRDALETLLSSPSAQDWTRIADMFLGPAPSDWHFTPKHRSNAFDEAAELQG
ncbi:unnamed protein product [Malassezia sympodialis ATCC 42132]|uniref:tRNA-dihydrouridine(47) synthase [NAD(P)(+)] n=1 Tax=Malassezia sympodialis (strain ATCC 42132) TaxID=1230383 RepID=M5E8A2_MALS4|nr:uncharacterized protein MSY001_1420 [Malassezia sympodialis ATCC 42132]CCU98714.1 unnamed protein product [Malassezia sympodialis ATCC 42132]SHO77500.1 Similar to S.cerevisiae protein DUS3 (Dihydrouridine synthase) [Malassezia sympodialis ATCC 42132]|eukprot:XP_018740001.1 uncharacterized protein MSY001_1420 [Malassezia sympodialis ATCC 42132]